MNWGGVIAEREEDYNAWHSLEHMPERLAVPGFRRGRRGVAVEGTPETLKYFMMYEADTAEVFISKPYLARLNDPTPWTQRILSAYVAPSRTVCRVLASKGRGVGGYNATVQIGSVPELPGWFDELATMRGVIGVHLLEGDQNLGQQPTTEKKFRESRGEPDRTVSAAVLVDTMDRSAAEDAVARILALPFVDANTVTATVYAIQHVIVAEDAAA